MFKISGDEIKRWRLELENAQELRKKEFGEYSEDRKTGAGENIEYFEYGFPSYDFMSLGYSPQEAMEYNCLNFAFPIIKNIIPSLYYKNPNVISLPKRKEDEESAPFVGQLLNHYYGELNLKTENQMVIFDAYVLGMGVCKLGYTTQFGTDIPDENLESDRQKEKQISILEKIGLRKPKEEEDKQNVELNEYIRSESPYCVWISPFKFLIDPRATGIHNAQWVCHQYEKTLKSVKENPNYKNTKDLKGEDPEGNPTKEVPASEVDNFKIVHIDEIHYKTDEGIRILVLARNGKQYEAIYHEDSIYKMDGFQFELLTFNKHGHKLYPKSAITIIKGLLDRLNITFSAILDQVDKFVPKIGVDESAVGDPAKKVLETGGIGAIVYMNKNPNDVVKEIGLTQLKGDLAALLDRVLDIVMLETGLTRAMLTGLTQAQTATEAQIGQAGSNLRLSDKSDNVQDFAVRQTRKIWQITRQFVDLEEIQLITGDRELDPQTGQPKYNWLVVPEELSEKVIKGEYDFQIEVGSTQKPTLEIIRKQFENMMNILMRPDVVMILKEQGKVLDLGEAIKKWASLYPDVLKDVSKLVRGMNPQEQQQMQMQKMMEMQSKQPGGNQPGRGTGSLRQQPPNMADIISSVKGGAGQGVPGV